MTVTNLHTADDLLAMGSDAPYELVDGRLQEFTWSDMRASVTAGNVVAALHPFVRQSRAGYLTGGAGYILSTNPDTVLAPDVGFVSRELLPDQLPRGYIPFSPTLAVEVMTAWETSDLVDWRAQRYLTAGTRVVWIVRPEDQAVVIHQFRSPAVILGSNDGIDGGEVLPGFRLPVAEVFSDPLGS
jgi:Uma2 family endonuclease